MPKMLEDVISENASFLTSYPYKITIKNIF